MSTPQGRVKIRRKKILRSARRQQPGVKLVSDADTLPNWPFAVFVAGFIGLLLLLGVGIAYGAGKFEPWVRAAGTYDGHNRIYLQWQDQAWHASRAKCMERAQAIAKDIGNRIWYWRGLKLDRPPVPSCPES